MVPAIRPMAAEREGPEQKETGRRVPRDLGKTLREECAEETCEPCLTTKSVETVAESIASGQVNRDAEGIVRSVGAKRGSKLEKRSSE